MKNLTLIIFLFPFWSASATVVDEFNCNIELKSHTSNEKVSQSSPVQVARKSYSKRTDDVIYTYGATSKSIELKLDNGIELWSNINFNYDFAKKLSTQKAKQGTCFAVSSGYCNPNDSGNDDIFICGKSSLACKIPSDPFEDNDLYWEKTNIAPNGEPEYLDRPIKKVEKITNKNGDLLGLLTVECLYKGTIY